MRHDFDERTNPNPDGGQLETEAEIKFKTVGVSIGSDLADQQGAVKVGALGQELGVSLDVEARSSIISSKWGEGMVLDLEGNLVDENSEEVFGRVAFGNLKWAIVNVGAGISASGLPEGTVGVSRENGSASAGYVSAAGGAMSLNLQVSAGGNSHSWNVEVPEEIAASSWYGGLVSCQMIADVQQRQVDRLEAKDQLVGDNWALSDKRFFTSLDNLEEYLVEHQEQFQQNHQEQIVPQEYWDQIQAAAETLGAATFPKQQVEAQEE
eukprot:GHVT01001982.1.p1 GENE.GHVT01001982.1~~GHVT01001982.1.p1  ORF type:complete len:266 (-),score=59.39 GHVT01001982.1:247-1044(-)